MYYTVLKAKLHQAHVTHAELEYDGSCAIDSSLLELSGIFEYEQIQIYNITNGERFTTYAIAAEPGSGIISANGAAAHKARAGDRVIICAYGLIDEKERAPFAPRLIYLNEYNRVQRTSSNIAVQMS